MSDPGPFRRRLAANAADALYIVVIVAVILAGFAGVMLIGEIIENESCTVVSTETDVPDTETWEGSDDVIVTSRYGNGCGD